MPNSTLTRTQLQRGEAVLLRVGQHAYRQFEKDRRSGSRYRYALPSSVWSLTLETIWRLKKTIREELRKP